MNMDSERLYYRYFTQEDFPLFYSVFSNETVMRYAWIDALKTEEEAKPFFEGFINNYNKINKNSSYAFAVFSKEDGCFVGFADIEIHSQNSAGGCGEIGYFLLPDFWGRGYATELANAMINLGFSGLGLHKISARCDSYNSNSERIMKKVGMTKEGELRRVRFKSGAWDDEKHYGILLEEWKAKTGESLI